MIGGIVKIPHRMKALELVILLGTCVPALYFWLSDVCNSGSAIKILQVMCLCIQMCFLTAVANLVLICCAELGIRFSSISEELRVFNFVLKSLNYYPLNPNILKFSEPLTWSTEM